MKCECNKREEQEKEIQELEKQFEQAKASVAYLQGALATYKRLIECDCGDECECKNK
jgi:predicted RNase H-like nuclease (RuvC/YqgF family)